MGDARDRDALIGQHLHIDFDEAVSFVFVVAGDAGPDRQLIIDMRGGKMLQFTTDMHPRTENDVVVQRPIAGSRNDDRVGEALFQVERLGFAKIAEALLDQVASDPKRADAE